MACFWFIFRMLCIICCIIAVTSYKIDHHSLIENRNPRAVTEWRFRRNYLFNFPYIFRSHVKNNHPINTKLNDHNRADQINSNEKKNLIPQLIESQSE